MTAQQNNDNTLALLDELRAYLASLPQHRLIESERAERLQMLDRIDGAVRFLSQPPPPVNADDKRVRLRPCGAKLHMPSSQGELVHVCQLSKHDDTTQHTESGIVQMPNSTARQYTISWHDAGPSALHVLPRNRVRA